MSFGKAGLIGLSNLAVGNAGNAAAQAAAAHAAAVHAAWANAAYMAGPMHAVGGTAASSAAMHTALAAVGTGVFAVGAAAGAVVLTRAVMNGMVTFSERLEAGAAAAERARGAVEAWDDAVLSVAARNARIRVLGAALRKAGVAGDDGDGGLPGPIIPGAMPVAFLSQWCEHVDEQLDWAEQRLARLASEAALKTLPTMHGGQGLIAYAPPASDLRPCYAGVAPRRSTRPDDATGLIGRVAADVDALLATLPRDVAAEDYAHVLHAAAQARKASQVGKTSLAEAWLQDLHTHVTYALKNAESRRADALAAATYLTALDVEAVDLVFPASVPPSGDEALGHLRRRLEAVLDGEKLTGELRAEAEDALITVRGRAEDALVRAQLRSVLQDMKYDVTSAESAGGLDITGPGLGDASVHVELSGQGFRARVRSGPSGWDEQRTDDWRQAWAEIERQLIKANLAVEVSEAADLTDVPAVGKERESQVDGDREDLMDDDYEDSALGRQLLHRERPS